MGSEILIQVEFAAKPGQASNMELTMRTLADLAREEPGCSLYAWFTSDDKQTVYLLEKYSDSAALRDHLETLRSPLGCPSLSASADRVALKVFADPDEDLKEMFPPEAIFAPVFGFTTKTA